jgi:Flp pilus assembly protein TadD
MITATTETLKRFQESPVDPNITLGPPLLETLVAAGSFSLRQEGNEIELQLEQNSPHEGVAENDNKLWETIILQSKVDIQRYPESARARINLGLVLLNRGQFEEAETLFSEALEREPGNYIASMAVARIKTQVGQLEVAKELYESLAKQFQAETAPLCGLAFIAMRQNRFRDAERLLRDLLTIDERSSLPKYYLALVLLKLKKPDEAIHLLKTAARSEVKWPAVHHALGIAYSVKGDLKRAERSLSISLSLAPNKRDSVHALSTVLLRQGDNERAIQLLRGYLEKGPRQDTEVRQMLARAYLEQKRYPEARVELTRVWNTIGNDPEASNDEKARTLNNIGICLANEADKAAETFLRRAVETSPLGNPLFYSNLARWLLRADKISDALAVLSDARAKFPANVDIWFLLAVGLRLQESYSEATLELIALISTGRATADAYVDLAWILSEIDHDLERAREVAQAGFLNFGHDVRLANNLAYVLLLLDDTVGARKVLSSLPSSAAESVYLIATNGLLRIHEGDFTQGRLYYQYAERLAMQKGDERLGRIVRQKMHLELARAYLRISDSQAAWSEVNKGLQVRVSTKVYRFREDLELLRNELSRLTSGDTV